ncbi:MAG: hypothetical protein QXP27_09810, partial [Candidatus Methanomethyliaceae archaeon]
MLVIAYLTIFGLLLAERGRSGLPAQPLQTAAEALVGLVNYLFHHPALYVWNRQEVPAAHLVLTLFARSAGLLGLALGLALLLGLPLGMAMATRRGTG